MIGIFITLLNSFEQHVRKSNLAQPLLILTLGVPLIQYNKIVDLQGYMKFIREHIVFRFLCFVMALHIFNCSVDMADPHPEYIPEDLSYNDMESVVEIVLEQVLNIDNAIAETDDTDSDSDSSLNLKKGLDFSYHHSALKNPCFNSTLTSCKYFLYKDNYFNEFHPEFIPPPPKA